MMKEQTMKNIAAVGIATLAVGATSTQVQADELQPVPASMAAVETTVKTQVVTQGQVDTAKANLDTVTAQAEQAQTDVNQAQSIVDNVQNETNQAQNALVEAQIAAEKATPEVITAQENEVAQAENLVSVAESAVAPAQEEVAQAQEKVTAQETVVAQEENKVVTAQADVVSAQKEVAQAQSNLDGTGQAQIVAEKEAATTAKQEAETRVVEAEAKLEQAQADDEKLMAERKLAQNNVDSAQSKWVETKNQLIDAQDKLSKVESNKEQAQREVASVKALVTRLEEGAQVKNIIQFPAGYAEALKKYEETRSEADRQALKELGEKAKELNDYGEYVSRIDNGIPVNSNGFRNYRDDIMAKAEFVPDARKLSESQRTELTKFAVELLNQIRQELGTPEVFANKSAIEFANEVANKSDNTTATHDGVVITEVAKKYGLSTFMNYNIYENLGTNQFVQTSDLTINDIKRGVYETILGMMFDDDNSFWGHATALGGVRNDKQSKYIGIGISTSSVFLKYFGTMAGRTHILSVADEQILDATKFDANANLPVASLEEELKVAKKELTVKQQVLAEVSEQYDEAQSLTAVAEANQAQASTDLSKAQTVFSSLQAQVLKLPQAEKDLDATQVVLTKATERVARAEKALANLTLDVKAKQDNLAQAKANLKAKEEALSTVKTKLSEEQTELARLKTSVANAEAKLQQAKDGVKQAKANLVSAQKELDGLKNAEKNLEAAKVKLAEKLDALTVSKTSLANKVSILNDLLKQKEITKAIYDELLARYELQVEAERLVKLEAKRVALEKQGEVAVAVKDDKGQVVDYVSKKAKPVNQVGMTYAQVNSADYQVLVAKVEKAMTGSSAKSAIKQGTEATLPATPSQENLALLAIGVGMTGLGLAGLGKKRKG